MDGNNSISNYKAILEDQKQRMEQSCLKALKDNHFINEYNMPMSEKKSDLDGDNTSEP